MKDLNALTDSSAVPWHAHPVFKDGGARFTPDDASFRHVYGDFA